MKKILLIVSIACLMVSASCKKQDSPSTMPPDPVAADTLSAGWQKINFIDSSDLADIFIINNTGFAVGSNAYKTSDGGNNWTLLTAASGLVQQTYLNIGMGNDKNAIFTTDNYSFVATRNGGETFTVKQLSDHLLTDVFFVDTTTAYAVGNSVWKTTNAGDNWTKLHDFTPTTGFSSIYFTNKQTGWVVKQNGVYKTTNGGAARQLVNSDSTGLTYGGVTFFVNADTGYVTTRHFVKKTVDGGVTFDKVFTLSYENAFHDIHFVSANVGYVTDGPRIFKTADGGNTWLKTVALAAPSRFLIELYFTDPHHGWACGTKGTILKFAQ
ncbi:MAG: WD40/YVTN/BNR-like repeat-containing protein [Ginsengibacter sp.]